MKFLSLLLLGTCLACDLPPVEPCTYSRIFANSLENDIVRCDTNACVEWIVQREKTKREECEGLKK